MRFHKLFARALFFVFLLACLLTGLAGTMRVPVNAAPQMQAATNIVISEFRSRGATASDEFVELFNPTTGIIDISGWTIRKSSGCGTTIAILETIPATTLLSPGQHYLFAGLSYSGSTIPDFRDTGDWGIADNGGVAILDASGTPVDRAGMCSTTSYVEGTNLSPLSGTSNQSYDRHLDGSSNCIDSSNNATDFFLRIPSDPQNRFSPVTTCSDPTPTPLPPPTAVPPLSVLINEVAWGGTLASNTDEWFELYNNTPATINLSGWRLTADDGSPDISLSGTILAGDYFVVARYSAVFNDLTPDLTYSSGSFANDGEILYLLGPNGYQVDTANVNGGAWPAGSGSPTYASMERRTLADDNVSWSTYSGTIPVAHDRNGNDIKGTPGQANWISTVTITPSPIPTATRTPTKTRTPTPVRTATRTSTPPPPPPPPPLLAINEFVPRPGHDWNNDGTIDVGDEYIEILNHGVVNVTLSGYRLDDEANIGSNPFSLPSITLKPGERVVFYGSETGLLLSDGGDGVRLLKPNGQLMDAYNYFTVDHPDQSFCRLPDNGGADDWNTNCYPTPGLQNSLSGSVLGPPILGSEDEPLCPIADTLPQEFVLAECEAFGHNIWNRYYWDEFGWYGGMSLPYVDGKWEVYAD